MKYRPSALYRSRLASEVVGADRSGVWHERPLLCRGADAVLCLVFLLAAPGTCPRCEETAEGDSTVVEVIGIDEKEELTEPEQRQPDEEQEPQEEVRKDTAEAEAEEEQAEEEYYGAQKGSVLFSATVGYALHISRFTREEEAFADDWEFTLIYLDADNNPIDTVDMSYTHTSIPLTLAVSYQFAQRFALGFQYEMGFVLQNVSNFHESMTAELLRYHSAGAVSTVWLAQKKRVGFSLVGTGGLVWGTLHRLPVIYEDYDKNNVRDRLAGLVYTAHEGVECLGLGLGLRFNVSFFANHWLAVSGGPRYSYMYLALDNDEITGYPRSSNNHDIGFCVNLAVVAFGRK